MEAEQDGKQQAIHQFIQAITPVLRLNTKLDWAAAVSLALTHAELYQEIVDVSRWSPEDYELWLTETLKQQLL